MLPEVLVAEEVPRELLELEVLVAEEVLRELVELLMLELPRLLPEEPRVEVLEEVVAEELPRDALLLVEELPRLLPLEVERLLMRGAFWLPLLSR